MQDADRVAKLSKNQTLQVQYSVVEKETTQSHVMQYGDETWTSMPIDDFEGQPTSSLTHGPTETDVHVDPHVFARHPILGYRQKASVLPVDTQTEQDSERIAASGVNARDIPLHLAYYRYLRADKTDLQGSHMLSTQLQAAITHRVATDNNFLTLTQNVMGGPGMKAESVFGLPSPSHLPAVECMQESISAYEARCGRMDDYALQYTRIFANLCDIVSVSDIMKGVANIHCVHAN